MKSLLQTLGIGVLTCAAILYSAFVILAALQVFFPISCQMNPICRALQIQVPTDRFGLLIFVCLNCAIVGNIWWAITWTAGEAVLGGQIGPRMRMLQVTANRARWIFWVTCGVMLLLPLIFVFLWLAIHLVGLVVVVPALVYKFLIPV